MADDMYCFCKQRVGVWSKKWIIQFDNNMYHCNAYFLDRMMFMVIPLILSVISSGSKKILRLFSTWQGRHSMPE